MGSFNDFGPVRFPKLQARPGETQVQFEARRRGLMGQQEAVRVPAVGAFTDLVTVAADEPQEQRAGAVILVVGLVALGFALWRT